MPHSSCHIPDHRWSFHSERTQPADFDISSVSLLTELQSVSPQQLMPPYRYSSESLALHLDPPLGPLSASPQVRSCVQVTDVVRKTSSVHMIRKYSARTDRCTTKSIILKQEKVLPFNTRSILSVILLL